jgi:predicted MFS family arabinose efflux permease
VLVGGALTELASWEAIFWINVPIGIAAGVAGFRLLPDAAPAAGGRVDVLGAGIATFSLFALIYGLVDADGAGWGSVQTLGLLGGGFAGLALFALVESRVNEPLVALHVFRRRPTVVALVLMMIGMGALVSTFFFGSLYLQHVLGHSALRTGLEFLPAAIATVIAARLGGHLIEGLGVRTVMTGGLLIAALGAWLLSGVSAGGSYAADVLPGLMATSIGVGATAAGIFITALSGATEEDSGLISGLASTAHEVGIALVVSVLSAVAAAGIGSGDVTGAPADASLLTAGFADAFTVASLLALAGAGLAVAALRREDVPTGAAPAFGH